MLNEDLQLKFEFHDIKHINKNDHILNKISKDNANSINVYWLGKRDYVPVWQLQKEIHKKRFKKEINDIVLLLEHNHVYTLGKNADKNHILSDKFEDTEVIQIDRGGDVTYHGPGQLVGYPIIDLHNYKMSINWYLNVLSDSIINLLSTLSINSHYRDDYVGVWVDDSKIAAFGVRLSKWITMHGFALNVNTNLKYYDGLIPCGIFECGVTSIFEQTSKQLSVEETARIFSKIFIKQLNKE